MGFEERIDPELLEGLVVYEALGLGVDALAAERLPATRVHIAEVLAAALAELPPNDRVVREDRTIPGAGVDVPVRIYRPASANGTLPCIVWIHGGGMIIGGLDPEDPKCDSYV